MDWKLELVLVPVSDVDRAMTFYTEQVGFHLDVDHRAGDDFNSFASFTDPDGNSWVLQERGRNEARA